MKSFLDRFRRKGVEADPPRKDEPPEQSGKAPHDPPRRTPPRKPPLTRGKEATPSSNAGAALKTTAAEAQETLRNSEVVTFELGDFLKRIPEQALSAGPHDPKLPLTFPVAELSARISRGQTTLPLAEIYQRAPQIFRGELSETENIEVRFPWQKLLDLVKAADASTPEGGLSESAAETLAQKVRTRKRNISPGPAGAEKPAAPTPRFPAARQPSWLSRPVAQGGAVAPSPRPQPELAPASAAPAAEPTFALESPRLPEPQLTPEPEPKRGEVSSSTQVLSSVAPRADESAAVTKPGLDPEKLGALQRELQAAAEERDRARAELKRLEQAVVEHRTEAERQRDLAGRTLENATRSESDRNALQKEIINLGAALTERSTELTQLQARLTEFAETAAARELLEQQVSELGALDEQRALELADLRANLAQLTQSTGDQLATVTQERDILLQHKAHLTQQVAQFRRPGSSIVESAPVEKERPRRESQRQVEELQRRIHALESGQKENAQALGREREARIKAERNAAAADRTRSEAAALVESIRGEMRHEAEAASRKRDAEFARQQNELGEQIQAVTSSLREAAAERDELRAEVAAWRSAAAEAESKNGAIRHEAEAKVHEKNAELEQQRQELSDQVAKLAEAEQRASAESDRLKSELAAMHDAVARAESTRSKDVQDAQRQEGVFARQRTELGAQIAALTEAQRRSEVECDQLRAQLAALKDAAAAVPASADWDLRTVSSLESDIENYRTRIKTLLKERDAAVKEKAQLAATRDVVDEVKAENEKFAAQLEEAGKERTAMGGQLRAAAERLAHAESGASLALAAHQEAAAAELARARASLTSLQSEHGVLEREHSAAAEVVRKLTARLEAATVLAPPVPESDELRAEAAQLRTELADARAAAETESGALIGQRDKAIALQQELAAELDRVRSEAGSANKLADEQRKAATNLAAERDREHAEIEAARRAAAEAVADRDAARAELEQLGREKETLAAECERLRNQAESFGSELDLARRAASAGSNAELDAANAQLESARETAAQLEQERAALQTEKETLTAELFKARAAAEEQAKAQGAKAEALAAQLSKARATADDRAKANAADATAFNAELTKARAAAEEQAKTQATLGKELTAARRERDELQARIKSLEGKAKTAQTQAASKAEELTKAARGHESALAALAEEKEQALAAAAEQARKAAAAAEQRDEFAASLKAERARGQQALVGKEKELAEQIASLIEERDLARRESISVAQRFAAMSLETDEKTSSLEAQLAVRTKDKEALAAEFEAAKANFEMQGAIFVRELKTVGKHRDEALAAADSARANLQEKAAALARERVAVEAAHEEAKAKSDREIARLRREREVLQQQREDLRDRLSKMAGEQNKLVEELLEQSGQPPVIRRADSALSDTRGSNVIDINDAEIVKELVERRPQHPGKVRPPQVRPVVIPPPNVRVL